MPRRVTDPTSSGATAIPAIPGWSTQGGDDSRPMAAEIYLAAPTRMVLPPSLTYAAHMLRGAQHWGLPHDYVNQLNHIPTTGRL